MRAIPWVFSWTQSRQLVPAWFGLGSAVAAYGRFGRLRAMYAGWPFFRATIDNAALALGKADMSIAGRYAALAAETVPEAPAIFARIREEFERSRQAVRGIANRVKPPTDARVLERSVRVRNPYVDALSYLQITFLRRLREAPPVGDPRSPERSAVLRTVFGIAHGLRNTG